MKVLQINSVCGIGSTGRIATDIHQLLINQGHESVIAYGRDLPMKCENTIKIGTPFDNYAHVALTRLLDKHGFGSKQATKEFIKEIEAINPDIIHLHNIHGYYIHIEELFTYLKKANKPVIWTLHDCWTFTGHCTHFDYIGCEKWQIECHQCPQKHEYPESLLIDGSKSNFKLKKEIFTGVKNLKIITPSKWLTNLVKQSFLKDYPVETVHNGIDLEIFQPTKSDFRKKYNLENKLIILGVSSGWLIRKGYDYFLELSKHLFKNQSIVLVGVSEKQKQALPKNIIGITRTNNTEELAEIYSAADVFVNPTLEDTFPTTNLEALACGTPIITFNTGGSVETVDDETGIIVEKGNIEELVQQINRVEKNGKERYTEQCRARADQHFDKKNKYQAYINSYVNLYQKR